MVGYRLVLGALFLILSPACGDDDDASADGDADADADADGDCATAAATVEGYGAVSAGGAGGDTCTVDSLADDGAGSLRDCVENRGGPRVVEFAVAGEIVLADTLRVNEPNLTIDGATAPAPGITITSSDDISLIGIEGTHDIVIRHLRIMGLWEEGNETIEGTGDITLDGDSNPDHIVARVVLDHLTLGKGDDSALDLWGEIADVTVQWCLLFDSARGGLVSHYPEPFQTRQRLSVHHNVYARNIERNPQVRGDVRAFELVNNVLYEWGFYDPASGYGIRLRAEAGEPPISASLVGNFFLSSINPDSALVYGQQPGADEDGAPDGPWQQGDVVPGTNMGDLWVEANRLPPENVDHFSTVDARPAVPAEANVTTLPVGELADCVPTEVGTMHRDPAEQDLLDEIAAAMRAAPRGAQRPPPGDLSPIVARRPAAPPVP